MKTNLSEHRKSTRARNRRNPQVDSNAVKIMRTLGDKEAFYFYEDVGRATGEVAKNLNDFLDKVKSAKPETLTFHLQRRDFQNWIEETLGDSKLARKLGRISSSSRGDVRMSICKAVDARIKELKESSAAISVDDNPTVLLPSC